MSDERFCPECRKPVAPGAKGTLCPNCLLRLGLEDSPPTAGKSELSTAKASDSLPGLPDRIGFYRILEKLGEGGMGVVYLAEQRKPIERRVALKVIKLGMDTRDVIARFEIERQLLALMNHPNIAKIHDAGVTEEGRPYFVMEHVKGVPITDYCDTERLDMRQRLSLFTRVCNAVQHAHQKGVIHRDLKPANILIALQDGRPVPKIIDFGVAKATEHRLTERTLFTRYGQLIGTPEYMSPEQADPSALDVDTRTDVYSLGVLLYELLVGALPFDPRELRRAAYEEIQRKIREDDPPKPSTRAGQSGVEATSARRTDASSLVRQLRGDLDWITMKALEKDRTRRYASASELAADVERHLSDQQVLAGSPSIAYRARKFVRRHTGAVVAACTVLVALALGLITSTTLYLQAEAARVDADRARRASRRQAYSANISAAAANVRDYHITAARKSLKQAPEEHRDWEWHYLNSRLDRSLKTLPVAGVQSVRFTPDGTELVVARFRPQDEDISKGMVRVDTVDLKSWHPTRLLEKPAFRSTASSVGGTGEKIAVVETGDTLAIWDIETGTRTAELRRPGLSGSRLSYRDRASKVLVSTYRLFFVWDPSTSEIVLEVGQPCSLLTPRGAALSPDGLVVAAQCRDKSLRLWNVPTGRVSIAFPPQDDRVDTLLFSPNGRLLSSGFPDGTIRVWDLDKEEDLGVMRGHLAGITALAFDSEGVRLASAGADRSVGLWEVHSGRRIADFVGHEDRVRSVGFSADGKFLASASLDGTVKLWDADNGDGHVVLPPVQTIGSIAFGPDSRQLAVDSFGEGPVQLGLPTGRRLATFRGRCSGMGLLDWSADGRWIAVDSCNDRVSGGTPIALWDVVTREQTATLRGHERYIRSIKFNSDATQLVSGGADKTIRIWDIPSGNEQTVINEKDSVSSVAFSPDGDLVVSGTAGGSVTIWHTGTGETFRRLGIHDGGVTSVAFSPDGGVIASGGDVHNPVVNLWDAASGALRARLLGHDSGVDALAFSPTGSRVVSASIGGTVIVWDATTGESLLSLAGRVGSLISVAFSPDGSRIAALGREGIELWDSRPAAVVLRDYSVRESAPEDPRATFETE